MVVAWSSPARDWGKAIDAATGLWPPPGDKTQLVADCLVQWTADIPGDGPAASAPLYAGAWFYLVPLSAVVSVAKLRSLIADPAVGLLTGAKPEEVFAETPEVLRFSRCKGELVPRQ
jgi:hypothetical protein